MAEKGEREKIKHERETGGLEHEENGGLLMHRQLKKPNICQCNFEVEFKCVQNK